MLKLLGYSESDLNKKVTFKAAEGAGNSAAVGFRCRLKRPLSSSGKLLEHLLLGPKPQRGPPRRMTCSFLGEVGCPNYASLGPRFQDQEAFPIPLHSARCAVPLLRPGPCAHKEAAARFRF